MGIKPKVIHIGNNEGGWLCDAEFRQVADKYLTDEFYRTLPVCPECESRSSQKQRAEWVPVAAGGLFDVDSNTPPRPPLVEESEVVSTSLEWWANRK